MKNENLKIEKLLKQYNLLLQQKNAIDEQIKALQDTLKNVADENGMQHREYFVGKTLKCRYDNYYSDKFNGKQLSQDMPDLYNKYIILNGTHTVRINKPELIQ